MATNGTQPWIERVWRVLSGVQTTDESQLRTKAYLHDGDGNAIGSLGGAINIHDADVHTRIVNRYMNRLTGTQTTLTAPLVGDGTEYQVTVADATGFSVGNYITIVNGSEETTYPSIKAIAGTAPATFTLDRRIDSAHAIGDTVERVIFDMSSAAGTIASPVTYIAAPIGTDVWHLTRLLFEMTHGTAGDLGLFGDLTALTNGVTLRVRVNGEYQTLTNWKDNGDIAVDMYDVSFDSRSGGGGQYGTTGRGTFRNAGAVLRLDAATNDRVELLVQDDITALASFTMKMQGHFEEL